MRAVVCRKIGDPTEAMSESSAIYVNEEQPRPTLSSSSGTSLRVRVVAASVNFATVLTVEGKYQERPKLPFIPGSDYAGIVIEVGREVTDFNPGDAVCGVVDSNSGTLAEEIVTEVDRTYKVPKGVDLVQAGGLPVAFGTSHVALVHRAHLQVGQVLLVLGAGGGVGTAAVQIGKICGAIVIAAARGQEKAQLLKDLGADYVVDPSDGGLIKSVQAFLKSKNLKGVDVLYDPVGGKLFKDSMKLLKWGAHILIIGFASGEIPSIPANIVLVKNWTVHGLYWGSYLQHKPEVIRESIQELLEMLGKGTLRVNVSHTFSLDQANQAFATIQQRQVMGKVMILPGEKLDDMNSTTTGAISKL
ncbi:unnamed protein product [Sphagnum troendelagicum]|uniref:Enoyl reductase (ER) domain-containing protein n=1 Tax=Sphagnum troendelagicum TaxID=128251 RepID=A0ABP0V3F8_9BRYO